MEFAWRYLCASVGPTEKPRDDFGYPRSRPRRPFRRYRDNCLVPGVELGHRDRTSIGWAQQAWLATLALATGRRHLGLHFVAMLAFSMPGLEMAYDVGLIILSLIVGRTAAQARRGGLYASSCIAAQRYRMRTVTTTQPAPEVGISMLRALSCVSTTGRP